MMTRAIADISLVQRLISMGSILLVVLVFATVVGFSFMLYLSPKLTALILPPLPFVFFYAWYVSREMGVSSRDVQDRMSDLGTHVQENLSGIRTIQAMVQEENEIRRFAVTNQRYSESFYRQAQINSLMGGVDAVARRRLLDRHPRLRRQPGVVRRHHGRHVHRVFHVREHGRATVPRRRFHRQSVPARRGRIGPAVRSIRPRAGNRRRTDRRHAGADSRRHRVQAPELRVRHQARTCPERRLADGSPGRVDHDHGARRRRQDDAAEAADSPARPAAEYRLRRRPRRARLSAVAAAFADRVRAAGPVPVRRTVARQPHLRRSGARAGPDLGSRRVGRFQRHRRRIRRSNSRRSSASAA